MDSHIKDHTGRDIHNNKNLHEGDINTEGTYTQKDIYTMVKYT